MNVYLSNFELVDYFNLLLCALNTVPKMFTENISH